MQGIIINRGDEMYSYKKEKKFPKRKLIVSLSCLLVAATVFMTYEYTLQKNKRDSAVFQEDTTPALSLPSSAQAEKGIKPFSVDAKAVLEYYDGKDSKVDNMTKFEGVYRANQGMDYAYKNEMFNVLAIFSGDVSDVKDDPVFGKSVTIVSKDITITYQSLSAVAVKKGDHLQQSDAFAKAGSNIYNKDLQNHLHIVVEKNKKIIDPKLVYEKTCSEIK